MSKTPSIFDKAKDKSAALGQKAKDSNIDEKAKEAKDKASVFGKKAKDSIKGSSLFGKKKSE